MAKDRGQDLDKALRDNLRKRKSGPKPQPQSQMRPRIQSINKKTGPKLKKPAP